MINAFLPENEAARLEALHQYKIIETPPEEVFDDITRLAAHICDTPIALITLLDKDWLWFKARVGIDITKIPRDIALCPHAMLEADVFIVPDTLSDPRFATSPLVIKNHNIRFYAGVPLVTAEGYALGTLCVLDRVPRELTPQQLEQLRILSRQVIRQIELRRNIVELQRTAVERQGVQKRHKRSKRVALGFGLATAIAILISVVSYRSTTGVVKSSHQVIHSQKVLYKLEDVLSQMKDAQTGQRGYIITGQKRYLKPYRTATQNVNQQVKEIRKLTAGNFNQQRRLDTLEPLLSEKFAKLKHTIELRQDKGFLAATQALITYNGENLMDKIRRTIHEMENAENAQLTQRSQAAETSASNTIFILTSGIFINFFIFAAVSYFIYCQSSDRKRTAAALEKERDFTTAVLDTAGALVVVLDLHGQIVRFNQACEQTTGYSFAEVKGNYFWKLFLIPEEVAEVRAIFEKFQAGDTNHYENYWIARNGDRRMIAWSNTLMLDQEKAVEYVVITGIDITERQQQEALQQTNDKLSSWVNELEQRNHEIAMLSKMSDFLQACLTLEEARTAIAQFVQPLFSQTSGGIFLINASNNLVEGVASWGSSPFASEKFFTPHECWALRRSQANFAGDTHSGLVCQHLHQPAPAESLCVPMMAQGDALGIMYFSSLELGQLTETKQKLAVTVAEHIALSLANIKLRETLKNQSIRDPLTGLFNRRYMEESLERELYRCDRQEQPLSIIMIDVDYFKRFNDMFGHDAGDTVLRELGEFLQKNIRVSDIGCRYGGEELTVILPEASVDVTYKRAERLREGIKNLNLQHRHQPLDTITISIGVASFPNHGLTGEAVLQAADAALYLAKKEGRDTVRVAPQRE